MKTKLLVLSLFLATFPIIGCGNDEKGIVPTRRLPTVAWLTRYDGLGGAEEDEPKAIAVDGSGNVYVTGYSGTAWPLSDYATIKYDSDGNQLWAARYDGPGKGDDRANSVALDNSGNVFVTGSSEGLGAAHTGVYDYATVKYDSDGNELWMTRYNGPGDSNDEAVALGVDSMTNVYVTGTSGGDIVTIKYDKDGNQLWVARYNGQDDPWDEAKGLAVDTEGNVYVLGTSSGNIVTIKYDTNGNALFASLYTAPVGQENKAGALAVDTMGNVYVTGTSSGDYITIKYGSDGRQLWGANYDGPNHLEDEARTLAVDGVGNVYVTGCSSIQDIQHSTQTTVKYDSSGNEIWARHFNGSGNPLNLATSLVLDVSGDVYATGITGDLALKYSEYVTIKYDPSGNEVWAAQYNGSENFEGLDLDGATALAVDGSSDVYVTGTSYASTTSFDYTTIKYIQ